MTGKLTPYPISAEVLDIRSEPLIVHFQLHADIPCEHGAVAALKAFTKAYPATRKGVLELAADIKVIAANVFGALAGMVDVQLEDAALLGQNQVEALLRSATAGKAPS